jgi:hypothetical protein
MELPEFRNVVVSQSKPHTVGNPKNQEMSDFPFSEECRPVLGLIQLLIKWIKRLEPEADYLTSF